MLPQYTYAEAKYLLQEGDVLLYRGTGRISKWIQRVTRGPYSHVSIASEIKDWPFEWESLQFREFRGGLAINLKNDISQSNSIIDVYRPIPYFTCQYFCEISKDTIIDRVPFDGHAVTSCMREFTGLPYNYNVILYLFRFHTRFWRDWTSLSTNDDVVDDDKVMPVCSTILSHCFSRQGFDLLYNRADSFMSPSDLSLSPRLNALFAISGIK